MSFDLLRRLVPGNRRSDICVAAYCHAFDPDSPARADGGTDRDDR